MIYVMSVIHGCYQEYKAMLKKINFSSSDVLFILGDVIDRGPKGFHILLDMMRRRNVIPLMGNHEYVALSTLAEGVDLDSDPKNHNNSIEFRCWYADGGKSTIEKFRNLEPVHRRWIIEYMKKFQFYKKITVNGRKFFLVHAGISDFEPNKPLEEYQKENFLYERMHYDEQSYFEDTTIISGHTPTFLIDDNSAGKIYHHKNHIVIDCGIAYGGSLACLCLNTMEEFYVYKIDQTTVYSGRE
ncbi:MAG: metallophosphoesterase [Bacillota bacterium]|nr:metallophosphoesterase [Bacillota bacterium]